MQKYLLMYQLQITNIFVFMVLMFYTGLILVFYIILHKCNIIHNDSITKFVIKNAKMATLLKNICRILKLEINYLYS